MQVKRKSVYTTGSTPDGLFQVIIVDARQIFVDCNVKQPSVTIGKAQKEVRLKRKLLLAVLLLIGTAPKVNAAVYPETMKICYIEEGSEEDYIEAETASGHVYGFTCDSNDYEIGDLISVLMEGKDTETILDDEIIETYYSGWYVN